MSRRSFKAKGQFQPTDQHQQEKEPPAQRRQCFANLVGGVGRRRGRGRFSSISQVLDSGDGQFHTEVDVDKRFIIITYWITLRMPENGVFEGNIWENEGELKLLHINANKNTLNF